MHIHMYTNISYEYLMCNRLAKAAKTQELASKFAPPDSLSGFSNLIRGGTINIKIVIKKKP